MLNQQLISLEITPLQTDITVGDALASMQGQETKHLPVVVDGFFEGLLSEEDLLDADEHQLVGDLQDSFLPVSVPAEDHFISAVKQAVQHRLQMVPVITRNREYLGAISSWQLLQEMGKWTGVFSGGALILLEMEQHEFSTGQLSRLVETNDAGITQLNTYPNPDDGRLMVMLRLNKVEVSDVVASLQRHDYQVVFYSGEEHYENELRQNYHNLMNFLTI